MPQMVAFALVAGILFIGDLVATRTRAWVPSVFICAVLFLAGYWTFFPEDIVSVAGLPKSVVVLMMYLLVTNMGTLLSLRELRDQWRAVTVSLAGIVGVTLIMLGIGSLLLDLQTVIVAIPPMVGGVVSAAIMSDAATQAGLPDLAVLAVLLYVIQGFAGYPLTSIMLKREGKRVLQAMRRGEWKTSHAGSRHRSHDPAEAPPSLFRRLPHAYHGDYFRFFRLALVACAAWGLSVLLAPVVSISPMVLCLALGVVAASIGFLERQVLQRANGMGFALMALMLFIFSSLHRATPEMLGSLIVPMLVCVVLTLVGLALAAAAVGRCLGISASMAYAVALTSLYGFPADYVITREVISSLTSDADERETLTHHMLPPMLVGGFVSVTIVSVILAGFLVAYI